jgi:hypothetical protein
MLFLLSGIFIKKYIVYINMRDIVTENIVRNALNESIDEFMLEEGWEGWKNLWNNPIWQQNISMLLNAEQSIAVSSQ